MAHFFTHVNFVKEKRWFHFKAATHLLCFCFFRLHWSIAFFYTHTHERNLTNLQTNFNLWIWTRGSSGGCIDRCCTAVKAKYASQEFESVAHSFSVGIQYQFRNKVGEINKQKKIWLLHMFMLFSPYQDSSHPLNSLISRIFKNL